MKRKYFVSYHNFNSLVNKENFLEIQYSFHLSHKKRKACIDATFRYHMDMKKGRELLIAKKEALLGMIALLERELKKVNDEIKTLDSSKDIKLTYEFYLGEVFQLLLDAGQKGITGDRLRKQLSNKGFNVNPSRFRVFLSRLGAKREIEKVDPGEHSPRWRLTPEGINRGIGNY